ncbi:hypothetical protein D3C87_679660 [compost metagenome]
MIHRFISIHFIELINIIIDVNQFHTHYCPGIFKFCQKSMKNAENVVSRKQVNYERVSFDKKIEKHLEKML